MTTDMLYETIAFAALAQSATQIQEIARKGQVDEKAIAPLMRSIIITTPQSIYDIYTVEQLVPGLKVIASGIVPTEVTGAQAERIKVALDIMKLAKNISRNSMIFEQLSSEVDKLRDRVLDMHADYETADEKTQLDYQIIVLFSRIYSKLVSPNFPKLIIYGEPSYLARVEYQEMIRALLLAGIRASVLWTQVGGKRYSLMFKYKELVSKARELLNSVGSSH